MRKTFGVKTDAVVAVIPGDQLPEIFQEQNIIISDGDIFRVGKVDYDEWADVFFFAGNNGEPLPLDEAKIAGEIVGYCPMSETAKEFIKFTKIA